MPISESELRELRLRYEMAYDAYQSCVEALADVERKIYPTAYGSGEDGYSTPEELLGDLIVEVAHLLLEIRVGDINQILEFRRDFGGFGVVAAGRGGEAHAEDDRKRENADRALGRCEHAALMKYFLWDFHLAHVM